MSLSRWRNGTGHWFVLSYLRWLIPNLTVVSFDHAGTRPPGSPSQDLVCSAEHAIQCSLRHADSSFERAANGTRSFTLFRRFCYLEAAIDFSKEAKGESRSLQLRNVPRKGAHVTRVACTCVLLQCYSALGVLRTESL